MNHHSLSERLGGVAKAGCDEEPFTRGVRLGVLWKMLDE
jgi:hypothetical protein